jgi:serine/threonine-protein kinase
VHSTDQLNAALGGQYTIERHLGEGGMATVYLARDLKHRRRVALKVLKPDLGAVVGPERFLSEIQVTANLQHPNLLPLFDSGAADGVLYYVMPYVEGESLRARLHREKQLPVDEAVRLATAIANALDYAHRHGVIHRDLKPENILLQEGQPLVADFGIALAVSNAGGNRITQTGLSLGTPQYMSPEQATGDRVIDARTDIYSLGAVMYEMLTGEPPHMGSTSQAVIARVLTEKPRPVRSSRPAVSEAIEYAVERALEKLPADRWATAREFCEALTGARIVTRSSSSSLPAGRPAGRTVGIREAAAWGLAAVSLAAVALLLLRPRNEPVAAVPQRFEIFAPEGLEFTARGSAAALSLSADGSTLVYSAGGAQQLPALYLRRMDDSRAARLPGTDSGRAPALSPDGAELLFIGGLLGGTPSLRHVATRGGSPRVIYDSTNNAPVAWGDTNQLVMTHGNRLVMGSLDGSPRSTIVTADSARGHTAYVFPSLLPDGKAALVSIRRRGAGNDSTTIGIVDIRGRQVTDLGIIGLFPRYSGTGHLLFTTPDGWLYAAPFDARKRRVTGRPFRVADGVRVGSGGAAAYTVARNGTIAYLPGEIDLADRVLVAVSRTGSVRALGLPPGLYAGPRVSPDGSQIALAVPTTAGPSFRNPDIWRFDTASKAMVRVTTDSSSLRPAWSRDGERIVFAKRDPIDTIIWSRPLYRSGAATPLFRARQRIADFALGNPGGYGIIKLESGNNASNDLWIVHMDSLDAPRPFLAEPYGETTPSISPDGTLLAYAANRTGRYEVYLRPLSEGAADVQVSVSGGTEPVWSRTGDELFYRGADRMMAAAIARTPRLAVTRRDTLFQDTFGRYSGQTTNYDISPNGEFVMLEAVRTSAAGQPIIVLMNWHLRARR